MSTRHALMFLRLEPLTRLVLRVLAIGSVLLLALPTLTAVAEVPESASTVHELSKEVASLPAQALLALVAIASIGGFVWSQKNTSVALSVIAADIAVIKESLHRSGVIFPAEPKR